MVEDHHTTNHLEEVLQIADPMVEAHHGMIHQEEDHLTIHHLMNRITVMMTMHDAISQQYYGDDFVNSNQGETGLAEN